MVYIDSECEGLDYSFLTGLKIRKFKVLDNVMRSNYPGNCVTDNSGRRKG